MIVSDEIYQRLKPKEVIKEELGGDYYYRCPWLNCDKIVRSDFKYCPMCGQLLKFPKDDYEEGI